MPKIRRSTGIQKLNVTTAVLVVAIICWFGAGTSRALAESPHRRGGADSGFSHANATCRGVNLVLKNNNPYPIWLGEKVKPGYNIVAPPNNNWELVHGESIDLCAPTDWISGQFWARSQCNFAGLYQSEGNSQSARFSTCNATSDCASLAATTGLTYDCVGGACMVDCAGQSYPDTYCNTHLPNSQGNAICTSNTNLSGKSICTYSNGYVCKSGDCGGLYQCMGAWGSTGTDTISTDEGGENPFSAFEITTEPTADGGKGSSNYDVSNVSGYNDPIRVTATSTGAGGGRCTPISCTSDLNATCPALLQVLEPPVAKPTGSQAPNCGAGNYCKSGACIPCPPLAISGTCINNKTCDIGCAAPGSLCSSSYPLPVSAPGASGLDCTSTLSGGSYDGSEYQDMYNAANQSTVVDPNHQGTAMFSGNQGTPTCWGDVDCLPNEKCVMGSAATGIAGLPSNVGICAVKSTGGKLELNSTTDCSKPADASPPNPNHCGGYPNSTVYTCVTASKLTMVGSGDPGVACLPAFNPPTYGIGIYDSSSGLFTGIGAPLNPEWNAAALWASGDGTTAGTTPYYEAFSNACPHQYAWTYDDHTGGFACSVFPQTVKVTFGKTAPQPTPAPTPTGTCAEDLLTVVNPNPPTLAFPALSPGTHKTLPVTVKNSSGATFKLSTKITTGNQDDFSVVGGTCTSRYNYHLPNGETCTYLIKLTADGDDLHHGVQSLLTITGNYRPRSFCSAASVPQTATVTLAGYVN